MVILLAPLIASSAIVVMSTAPRDAFGSMIVSHIGLDTQDGFDSLFATFFVKLDDAVHIAVIGDSESFLTILGSLGDEFSQFGGAVKHGVLGVYMQVGE